MLSAKKFAFEEFELDGARRRLFRNGEAVALNSKTFDLLLALVTRHGEVLSKDELMDAVWEGQFVEEGNLAVHISNLRKILGETKDEHRFIVTIPNRGYRFIAKLKPEPEAESDIIVESHSLARIVVEEEIEEEKTGAEEREIDTDSKLLNSPLTTHRSPLKKLIIASLIVLVLGIGGFFLIRELSAKRSASPFQQIGIRQITSKGNISAGAISPDGKLFVYSAIEGEQESLWVGHVDGGEPVQIRPPANVIYMSLKFTPDGSSLYYTVGENFGGAALYKMPVLGGVAEKIHDKITRFSFAPDGKRYAFIAYDEKREKSILMTADASGADEREIAVLPSETSSDWGSPAWSPDGSTIALIANVKPSEVCLFTISASGGTIKSLGDYSWRLLSGLNWLKDGSGLVAVGVEQKALLQQVWLISFPNGEARRLTTDLNDYALVTSLSNDETLLALEGISQSNIWVAPSTNLKEAKQTTFSTAGARNGWLGLAWTTDGRILYPSSSNEGTTIWIMNADGTKQKQLIPSGGVNDFPSVTADGRYVVFQSNRSGHYAVWRADLNGENLKQLTGDQIAGQPYVSPDGKWIIYNSNDDGLGELYRIPIDGGEALKLTNQPAGWAQISPDSQHIACLLATADGEKLAVISINGGEPQKTFDLPRLFNLRQGIHWTADGKALAYRDWKNGLWKQNLEGGAPTHIENLPEEKIGSFGWSPDGKSFVYTRIITSRDVVLIQSVK